MYEEMFDYVKTVSGAVYTKGSIRSKVKADRFGHTKRVYHWAKKLAKEYEKDSGDKVDLEALEIASIFHDVAYGIAKYPKRHSTAGAEICRKYLTERGYEGDRIDFICHLIKNHSDKEEWMEKEDTPIELILLMEADLLEGTGAIGIIGDVWQETTDETVDYTYLYKQILKFSYEHTKYNPMKTNAAKTFWNKKQELLRMFISQLEMDLGMNGDGDKRESDEN